MKTPLTAQGEKVALDDYFTDVEIAQMLGRHEVTVRKWRAKNTRAGYIKYGPPYEYRDHNVVYPKQAFREWCAAVEVINGVPHLNLPRDAEVHTTPAIVEYGTYAARERQ